MRPLSIALVLTCGPLMIAAPSEVRPGVWVARGFDALPLPTRGYEVYLIGEYHGLEENAEFQIQYLARLHRESGLRDVAIEEDAVYENDAQAFVDGKSGAVPPALCLRAGILQGIRRLNARLSADERIRIHLTDIDSPAPAIRRHLIALAERLQAKSVKIPGEAAIKTQGLEAVAQLKLLKPDASTQSELRTVEFSIQALQQGLEIDVGPTKGSSYLDSREAAVAGNILDLIRTRNTPSLLVLYGDDHVSRTPRKDGGPQRNQPFNPTALRLEQAGIKTFSVISYPLQGRSSWRGRTEDLLWTPADGHLASGETLDKVLSADPEATLLYIDTKREKASIPSDDLSRMSVDAFLLFRSASALKNQCAANLTPAGKNH